jgi:hypothetical protein
MDVNGCHNRLQQFFLLFCCTLNQGHRECDFPIQTTAMKTIEKNLELPPHPTKGAGKWQTLLKDMEIGDSFVLTQGEDPKGYVYHAIRVAAKSLGMKVRSGTDENKNRIVKRII